MFRIQVISFADGNMTFPPEEPHMRVAGNWIQTRVLVLTWSTETMFMRAIGMRMYHSSCRHEQGCRH